MTTVNNENTTNTQTTQVQPLVKRGRGRPKGSKNKAKIVKTPVSKEIVFE